MRALLLTDVVDSTRLTERLGDAAMARLWAAHDRAARDLLRAWRGLEIDRSDGFLLLFETATDALHYALAYHRVLAALEVPPQVSFKARVGLHVGPVVELRNSAADVALGAKPLEIEGAAKPLAARVMSVARGGQTLLTSAARAALTPTTVRLRSHGHWRVKGLAEPIELHEAGDEGAPFTPPPDGSKVYRVALQEGIWLPLREIRHSLPAERDAFVGRHGPLLELARRFDGEARLVSLLGMGGTGKTRLATRFGRTWLGDFPGGVWFCDLAQARDVDGIAGAVAQGLALPPDKGDPVTRIGAAIAGRGTCLVVLDNFEQVARHAAATLGHWLDQAPLARFLVTTREVLGLAGEQTLALPPLPAPEAAELFLSRARAVRGELALAEADAAAVAPLVHLLDGLPLAIELAAARVRVMPPRTLLARMSERFRLLASGGGRHDRQATLRATFDWSWELLTEAERCVLAQLSVFEGGFTLEAVEAVVDLAACAGAPWIVDLLQSLVDKSFVRAVRPERFDLLGSVRAYAAEHLAAAGHFPGSGAAALAAAQARHGIWFAARGPGKAVDDACADLANLAAACRWALAAGAPAPAVGALQGAWAALSRHGPFSGGLELAQAVCALPGLDGGAALRAQAVLGGALDALGRKAEARTHYERALAHARGADDDTVRADLLIRLAALDRGESRIKEARAGLDAALALATGLGDAALECAALNGLAVFYYHQGQLDEALARHEAVLTRADAAADAGWQCGALSNLGTLHANAGRMEAAHACFEQALPITRRLGDRKIECTILCNLGMLHLVQRRLEAAIAASEQALVAARELGHKRVEATVLCNLGLAQEDLGDAAAALARFDAALQIMRTLGDRRGEGQFLGYIARTQARLGQFTAALEGFAAGQALLREVSDALSLGVLLCDSAVCALQAGDAAAARKALDEALALAGAAGAGAESELGQALARAQRQLDAAASG
ncbi:ATP-binding protein [Rubrivivax sp. A210]|uniref:ATP-binding protein n=1 Tax=Rubrivivax sp. A210 TaxID=2772301 RepID=UPI00191A27C0|nr:tetratricopeptide repeat protein [Rubrivivax sp. A210]